MTDNAGVSGRSPFEQKMSDSNGCILSTIGKPKSNSGRLHLQGETHGFEKTQSQGVPKRWRCVGRLVAGGVRLAKGQTPGTPSKKIDELIAYGDRSRFVTSIRVPVAGRHSPDEFGLTFHVLAPLQDSVGIITPSSLHYTATHRATLFPTSIPGNPGFRATPDRNCLQSCLTCKPIVL